MDEGNPTEPSQPENMDDELQKTVAESQQVFQTSPQRKAFSRILQMLHQSNEARCKSEHERQRIVPKLLKLLKEAKKDKDKMTEDHRLQIVKIIKKMKQEHSEEMELQKSKLHATVKEFQKATFTNSKLVQDVVYLKKQNNTLEIRRLEENVELKRIISRHEDRMTRLVEQQTEDVTSDLQSQSKKYRLAISQYADELSFVRKSLESSNDNLLIANRGLAHARTENERLRDKLDSAMAEIDLRNAEKERLEKNRLVLMDEHEVQMKQFKDEIKLCRDAISKEKKTNHTLEQKLTELKYSIKGSKGINILSARWKKQDTSDEKLALVSNLASLRRKVAELQTELFRNGKVADKIHSENFSLKSSNTAHTNQVKKLENLLSQERARVIELEQETKKTTGESMNELKSLRTIVSGLRSSNTAYVEETANLRYRLEAVLSENHDLEISIAQLQKDISIRNQNESENTDTCSNTSANDSSDGEFHDCFQNQDVDQLKVL